MNAFYLENRNKLLIASVCSMLLVSSGCNKQDDPKEHLDRGVEYFKKGEYEKAQLELKTSNQSNKNTAETYYYLALLDEKNRQFKAMKENLIKNLELAPDHTEARMKLGKVELLFGEINAAMEQADIVLKSSPGNEEALSLKASVLVRQKKYEEALGIIDGILKNKPDYTDALSLKALVYMEKEDLPAAIRLINDAIKVDGKNVALYLFKIQLDAKSKDINAVIEDYKKLVELFPENQDFKITLARIYAQSGKQAEAETILKKLVADEPESSQPKLFLLDFLGSHSAEKLEEQINQFLTTYNDQPKILFDISSWMISRVKYDQATKVLDRIVELEENSPLGLRAKTTLAKIAFENKKFEEADKIVAEILDENSNYDDAKILSARLLLVREKYDEAIVLLNKILWAKSDSEEAMLLLGQAYIIKGEQKDADKQFAGALAVNPASPQALAYVYEKAINTNDIKYAKEILQKAIAINPNNIEFLEKQAKVNLLEHNWNGVEDTIKRITEIVHPLAPSLAMFLKGEVFQGKAEWSNAITEYKSLLAKFPENREAMNNLAQCYERLNKRSEMIAFLNGLIAKNANNLAAGTLLVDLQLKNKDYAKSSALLTNLIQNNPGNAQLYITLANLKLAQNDSNSAIAAYKEGLKQSPGHLKLSLLLASALEDQGHYDEATAIYEEILVKNPLLDVAKNNLATLLIERYNDPEKLKRAIELVHKFKDSDQSFYRDTYAWAMIKDGKYNEGLDILNSVITKSPDVPVFRYHLAVANYKFGNITTAMSELREALDLSAKKGGFSEQKAAEDLLKEITAKLKTGQ